MAAIITPAGVWNLAYTMGWTNAKASPTPTKSNKLLFQTYDPLYNGYVMISVYCDKATAAITLDHPRMVHDSVFVRGLDMSSLREVLRNPHECAGYVRMRGVRGGGGGGDEEYPSPTIELLLRYINRPREDYHELATKVLPKQSKKPQSLRAEARLQLKRLNRELEFIMKQRLSVLSLISDEDRQQADEASPRGSPPSVLSLDYIQESSREAHSILVKAMNSHLGEVLGSTPSTASVAAGSPPVVMSPQPVQLAFPNMQQAVNLTMPNMLPGLGNGLTPQPQPTASFPLLTPATTIHNYASHTLPTVVNIRPRSHTTQYSDGGQAHGGGGSPGGALLLPTTGFFRPISADSMELQHASLANEYTGEGTLLPRVLFD